MIKSYADNKFLFGFNKKFNYKNKALIKYL